MDIKSLYHSYLQYKESERVHRKDNFFHASAAGSCYKKQLYKHFDYPEAPMDDKSYRILRLGTIVHKEIEDAINWHNKSNADHNKIIYTEHKIFIDELNVTGTYDAGVWMLDSNMFKVYDLKTVAAYKWTKKFGRKVNREVDSDRNYKMQIGTYALGINDEIQPKNIEMYLVWYNKNTSMIREQLVSPEWITKSLEYWVELNNILEDCGNKFEEELKPEYTVGVPFQSWECSYCQFKEICLTKKKG
jgi:hypothetical protein